MSAFTGSKNVSKEEDIHSIYLSLLQKILTTRYSRDTVSGKSSKFSFAGNQKEAVQILRNICTGAEKCFQKDSVFLRLPEKAPTIIIGDLHGQIHDLQRILFDIKIDPMKNRYIFLGDLVDRGDWSIEVTTIVFLMKILFPKNVFVLRGNHECPLVNNIYGFQEECERTFDEKVTADYTYGKVVWSCFNSAFQQLPLCALVQGKIFCTHGGISPHIEKLEDLDQIDRSHLATIPDDGIVCDLTWADPEENTSASGYTENERGCSVVFNSMVAKTFCEKFNLFFICRAHQMVDNGFEFFAEKHLITVFSASNYCGDGDNTGAVLCIFPDEQTPSSQPFYCSFVSFPVIANVSDLSIPPLPFMTASGKDFFISFHSKEDTKSLVKKSSQNVQQKKRPQRSPSPLPYRPSFEGGRNSSLNRSLSVPPSVRQQSSVKNSSSVQRATTVLPSSFTRGNSNNLSKTSPNPTIQSSSSTTNNIKVVKINTSSSSSLSLV
jgi:serine/threonine-protein phosphatase PP1 catalytic subunit